MSGRIPQAFIDELLNRIDIVDVIDSRVQLKKAGRDYTACCPFHNEKTPSFTVSQTKQFYHCFGCGAHGTALGFLMDYEHLSFPEAIEELAERAGLEVPREAVSPDAPKPQNDLYHIMEQAAAYYRKQLRAHPAANQAIEYLKRRGMSGEIAAEFGVGYAPPGWNNLVDALGKDPLTVRKLIEAGLLIEQGQKGPYDRFRERIMIPIRDRRGRVIAFGGRILEGDGPKYLNSPETPIFHKGRELYGLFEARKALRHPTHLLVVEGYMDVLALAQYDIRYAVATLGTATTRDHLETLYRVVPRVVFCFDGDRAGREAAWRALENALPVMQEGRQAAFLFLPEGEDPDSLVRKEGKEAFERRIQDALPLSRFFYESLSRGLDLSLPDDRARLVELARPLLARMPDNVFHHMMLEDLARLVGIRLENLKNIIKNKEVAEAPPQSRPSIRKPVTRPGRRTPIRLAISLLLQNPALASDVEDYNWLNNIDIAGSALLHALLEILHQHPNLSTAALLERWRDQPEWEPLNKLALTEIPGNEESLKSEFLDTLQHLQTRLKQQRWEELQTKLNLEGLTDQELSEWKQLLAEMPAGRKTSS